MSLYYDAASILTGGAEHGSLKSRIYNSNSNLKSKPAQVYALISECAKYDAFLKEVIDNTGILNQEPKVCVLALPLLSLLLVHDHFFSKGGIAASANHVLRQSIERHKARLQAEFTKARLRRKCATIKVLKDKFVNEKTIHGIGAREQPRWVRINRLKTTVENLLQDTLDGYSPATSFSGVLSGGLAAKVFWRDCNIPDLLALPPDATNLTRTKAYADGDIVLQDKASCFPAQLLLGANALTQSQPAQSSHGDIMDACAAPGNKTTHLSAILAAAGSTRKSAARAKIFACERDAARSKTLQKMVDRAGAADVVILARQDFLALDISEPKFANVTHLLLDPSCSGTGIVGREDIPALALPTPASRPNSKSQDQPPANSRKRRHSQGVLPTEDSNETKAVEEEEYTHQKFDTTRLERLSNLQFRIIEHAFAFPAATRITYSTCSVHAEENERVVERVLQSSTAICRGWKLLLRRFQFDGLKEWKHRGVRPPTSATDSGSTALTDEELDACIRCYPNDDEGTMGFFVCCFIRDANETDTEAATKHVSTSSAIGDVGGDGGEDFDDDWSGFDD